MSPPPSLDPGGVETAVVIGVVVAVAMVILILLVLAAFVTVLVCLKHKTTSESERRWGGEGVQVVPLQIDCCVSFTLRLVDLFHNQLLQHALLLHMNVYLKETGM